MVALAGTWSQLSFDVDQWNRLETEAKHYELWRVYPPERPFGSWPEVLRAIHATEADVERRKADSDTARQQATIRQGERTDLQPPANGRKLGKQGSNSTSRILRRLARHDAAKGTDFLGAYERGEYRSARAAGIAAGIVKVPPPAEQIRKLWKKLTAKQRRDFLRWAEGD